MKKSTADLFEEHRDAVLDLLADGIEAYHRKRRILDQALPDPPPRGGAQDGDFLNDFLHLNVEYLNQLARLGSSYSLLGARALERLYEWCQPSAEPEAELDRLENRAGARVTYVFDFENPLPCAATFSVTCTTFRSGEHEVDLEARFDEDIADPAGPHRARLDLEAHEEVAVRVSFAISSAMRPGVGYRGQLLVHGRAGVAERRRLLVRRVGR